MTPDHLERARQLSLAARRRADLERWRETFEAITRVKPRSDEERQAQHEAMLLLEQAKP